VAVKAVSAFRDTQADPPFNHFIPFNGIISELMRRRQNTEEGRFAPLFASYWDTTYVTFTAAFPMVRTAWEMTRAIKTLCQSADITLSFTPHGLDGLCIRLKGLLRQLEVESPGVSSSTEDRIASLLTLLQRSAALKTATAESGRLEGDEKYDKLLADPRYADLLSKIVAVNTSDFDCVDALRIACKHEHAAGHIIVATTRTLPQTAWASVLGMRQKSKWQLLFDSALSVDRHGVVQPDWGVLLPMKNETPVHAQWLILGQLDRIPDWWSMLSVWVGKYHGYHVLELPTYAATSDPMDFWLSADRLRLTEPALSAIFATIAHGQSRSVAGSFRQWHHLHLDRCTQLQHVPAGTLAYSALIKDTQQAVRLLMSNFAEASATMFLRPFHEVKRHLFNPAKGAATLFQQIDETMLQTQAQLSLARKGLAAHQNP
jgi:hypothetical protein